MRPTIDNLTTFFTTREKADTIAAANQADDSEWVYKVEPAGLYFVISVSDSDGTIIGYL